ncbi:MAG: hypothetical protein HP490_05965 [Nitrospira sp.]|nr:hypothetical protein [Nitrospira sp.]
MSPMSLSESIRQEARALGFDAVGIARVDAPASPLQHGLFTRLTQWLTRNFHGAMAWMERTPEKRTDPRLVLPGCRSIISVGINYLTDHRPDAEHGSWLLLGEILTTLDLEPDEPATDLCGSCTLCIQACPTKAIVEPYVVDATRCISYLTIELRGDHSTIPDELQSGMGNKIFGCDDCLDVCPFNLRAEPSQEPAFQPRAVTLAPRLDDLTKLDEPAFATLFQGSPIKRAKHSGLLRNVSIAQKNQQRS